MFHGYVARMRDDDVTPCEPYSVAVLLALWGFAVVCVGLVLLIGVIAT